MTFNGLKTVSGRFLPQGLKPHGLRNTCGQPISLSRKIINYIRLVFRKIWNIIRGKKEVVYLPEPVGLKYAHVQDLTEEKLKELSRNPVPQLVMKNESGEDYLTVGTFYSKDEALRSMFSDSRAPSQPTTYIIRNRKNGVIMITKGTLETLKAQYNNDYEIIEPAIKD